MRKVQILCHRRTDLISSKHCLLCNDCNKKQDKNYTRLQTPMGGTQFIFYMVELVRIMVDSLSFRRSRRRCTKYWVNGLICCLQYLERFFGQQDAQHAHHLSMNAERALLVTRVHLVSHLIGSRSMSYHLSSMYMCVSPCVASPLLLPPVLPCLLLFLPPFCTTGCTLSSTTRSPWKSLSYSAKGSDDAYDVSFSPHRLWAQRHGAQTARSSTTRSPASSSTPRIPSSTSLRRQTTTWMTRHSASYSLKYTENTPITAVRKVCLSVRRQCLSRPIERGNFWKRVTSVIFVVVSETCIALTISFLQPLNLKERSIERRNLWKKSLELLRSGKAPVHRLGLLFDEQRQTIIAECCDKISHHEFQSSSSRTRTQNSTRRIMASAKGFSWSSSTKSYWDGGMTKIPEFYFRHAREAHRGSEHYFGIIRQSTRITKWSKLYELF